MSLRTAGPNELCARELYALLRLRAEVFVVEQQAAYLDLDGRDLAAGTRHCWIEEDGVPVSALRILARPDGSQIGRVVTAAHARGRGLADRLLRHALRLAPRPVVLDAQTHLREWYARYGFEVTGPAFTYPGEDIPHIPMILR